MLKPDVGQAPGLVRVGQDDVDGVGPLLGVRLRRPGNPVHAAGLQAGVHPAQPGHVAGHPLLPVGGHLLIEDGREAVVQLSIKKKGDLHPKITHYPTNIAS